MVDATTDTNFLAMSDEDILNMNGPPEVAEPDGSSEQAEAATTEEEPAVAGTPEVEEPAETADEADKAEDVADGGDTAKQEDEDLPDGQIGDKPPVVDSAKAGTKEAEAKPEAEAEPKVEVKADEQVTQTPEQYENFYKQIMTPFKANGKMIELKSPEEAIQLMQMGANYTRKLQDIQPHRKTLLMLENNGLLDEGKLSFLIDLDKKDPEAIKKLIKDSGIDPLDIDTSTDPEYSAGNHIVSNEEDKFRQVLDEVNSSEAGKETVQLINSQWDEASKEVLWESPEIMSIIHEQRENGIYTKITTELDRQKVLGTIPADIPFLQAYKIVGDQLAEAKAFDDVKSQTAATPTDTPAGKPEPVAVATRVATPKSPVVNEDKASAASSTRSTPRAAKVLVNPLAMADDEFMSQMANRL